MTVGGYITLWSPNDAHIETETDNKIPSQSTKI